MAAAAQRRRVPFFRAARLIPIGYAVVTLLGRYAFAQEPCRTGVFLEGELEIVGTIAQVLRQRGIGEQVGPGCPLVRAHVERRGAAVWVRVTEETRRTERGVTDTTAAATFIESWARSDISAPLLAAMPFMPQREAPPLPASPQEAPASPARPLYVLGLELAAAVDVSGGPWLGGALRGCVRAGPLCIGGLWRMAGDLPGARGDGFRVQRLSVDLLLAADLPVRLRRVVLSPGLGLGVGWLRTEASGELQEDSSGSGSETTTQSVRIIDNDGGLRAQARLVLSVPIHSDPGRGLAIDLGLFLDAAFLGSSPIGLALPTGEVDKTRLLSVPGMPWGMLRGAVGLSWGG